MQSASCFFLLPVPGRSLFRTLSALSSSASEGRRQVRPLNTGDTTMEPVPETERMEEFRVSPVPRLRLQDSTLYEKKPPTLRRSTDPNPSSPLSPIASPSIPYRPRNTSPYSRGHLRSKSSTGSLAPPMARAQSMPGFNAAGHLLSSPHQRPASPLGSPSRNRTPRKPVDEVFPGLPNRGLKDISEADDTSEDHTPRATERSSSPILGLPPTTSFTRTRRPSSPLRYLVQHSSAASTASSTAPTTPSSITSSPSYQSSRFNDNFLGMNSYSGSLSYPGSYASSSMPSTRKCSVQTLTHFCFTSWHNFAHRTLSNRLTLNVYSHVSEISKSLDFVVRDNRGFA